MRNDEAQEFRQLIQSTFEVFGVTTSADALTIWWNALAPYSLAQVRAALSAHVQSSVYQPKPADVISAISANDGRPGPEEAWGTALHSRDESDTVIWTEETAQAMAACHEILQAGDKVGARMAFRERYERLVADARSHQRPVRWQVSLGHEPERRQQALQEGIEAGQIGHDRAAALLGHAPEARHDVSGYLEHDGGQVPPEKARENLRALQRLIAGTPEPEPRKTTDPGQEERTRSWAARRAQETEHAS